MKKIILCFIITISAVFSFAQVQDKYVIETIAFQKKYVADHAIVKGGDKNYLQFFTVSEKYNIVCSFEKSKDTSIVRMQTTSVPPSQQFFKRYGFLTFEIEDSLCRLTVFEPLKKMAAPYDDYLFIPFIDNTSAIESYGSGRYLDMKYKDFENKLVSVDFNKAYNPYCAYTTGFNCPVPPKENFIPASILAGEKNFGKKAKH